MRPVKKILSINVFVCSIVLLASSPAMADWITTHTETHYTINDELFSSYTAYDLKDLARKVRDRMISLSENAAKKLNNLLPMQGNARAITMKAKEQADKLKDQQLVRNRVLQNQNDLRQKVQDLARLRSDLKSRIRLDR